MRATRVVLAAALALIANACAPAQTVTPSPEIASPAATTPASGIGGIATRTVAFGDGLQVDVPASWALGPVGIVNRATQRYLFAGDGDPASLPTVSGNGDVDGAALPAGRFVFEIESFCRLVCQGPETEAALPLDWSTATSFLAAVAIAPDHHQQSLAFRWFDRPYTVIARWADPAPPDIALFPSIVASIRPAVAPPTRGEYRGWDAIGDDASIPVGTVRLEPLPPGAVIRPPYRTWDNEPFFIVRGKLHIFAWTTRPLVDRRCIVSYDASSDHFTCTVDARTYAWTRFGRYLGPEPMSDLGQHRVIARDGIVWVYYYEYGISVPSVQDEAAER